jgi:Zn-dependent protease with chaperone function
MLQRLSQQRRDKDKAGGGSGKVQEQEQERDYLSSHPATAARMQRLRDADARLPAARVNKP